MNILQIAPAYYPAISIGGPIYSTLTFSEILEKNNNLTTITTQLGLSESQIKDIIYNQTNQLTPNHSLIYKKYIGPANLTFSISIIFWLFKNVKKYDLVILQGIWNVPFIITSYIARIFKIPYIVFPHGTLYKETMLLKSANLKKIFYALFIKKMLMNAKYICFTTKDESQKVIDFLRIKISPYIIPNVVKKDDFKCLPSRGKFRKTFKIDDDVVVLLHFGRITKKKGLEYTINALNYLITQNNKVELIIAGGDEEGYKKEILKKINDLGLDNKVHFTGLLDRSDSLNILVDSDIFVLPSYSENFGISIVEAMYCNLPVVISDNVGISDEISLAESGYVFSLNANSNNLEYYLTYLINNPKVRFEIGRKGYFFAENNYDINVLQNSVNNLLIDATK